MGDVGGSLIKPNRTGPPQDGGERVATHIGQCPHSPWPGVSGPPDFGVPSPLTPSYSLETFRVDSVWVEKFWNRYTNILPHFTRWFFCVHNTGVKRPVYVIYSSDGNKVTVLDRIEGSLRCSFGLSTELHVRKQSDCRHLSVSISWPKFHVDTLQPIQWFEETRSGRSWC